jgi:hypothetical protein
MKNIVLAAVLGAVGLGLLAFGGSFAAYIRGRQQSLGGPVPSAGYARVVTVVIGIVFLAFAVVVAASG